MVMLVIVLGGVVVAVTMKPSDSSGASSPLCRDTSRCLLPPPVYLFCPFSSFSPSVSLGLPVDIPGFWFVLFRSFLSQHCRFLSLSVSLTVFYHFFLSFLSSSFRVTIYRGRGSGVDPSPSHCRPCMGRTSPALPLSWQRWPMEASLAGHGCSGISSWDGWPLILALKHVGGRDKGKKTKLLFPCCTSRGRRRRRRRNSAASKQHHFVFFFKRMKWRRFA